jgi:hypothetical protein
MRKRLILALLIIIAAFAISAGAAQSEGDDRWWPVQALPKTVIRTTTSEQSPLARVAHEMLVQSVAGLATKAVNERQGDELVWVETGNSNLEDWFARWLASHPGIASQSHPLATWDLVDHFAKRGIVKGYILYTFDTSRRDFNTHTAEMDCSVNIATSLAGILNGVIVDESLQGEAIAHGLKRLVDAREKTQSWCFENYRDQFNRTMLCTQDPKKPHIRDFAIAQKAFTVYGGGGLIPAALTWLEPLSSILGWNGGDEFKTTDLSSRLGHIQTATDWCMNLPVLMAGSEKSVLPKAKTSAPVIDWTDHRSAVSFVQTDGDNVQWLQGNFFHGNPSYWANPDRGRIPFGWSCCFAQLAQLCPQAIDFAMTTRASNDSFVEWGGGYYYPDRFALDRKDRWGLLAQQSCRTCALMKKTNTRIIGFNVQKHDSADARKAYEVFARETDGLLGIFVFQYYPYEGGAGKTFWVKDRDGLDLPVVTARYSIWENSNERPRSGTPAKISREIRQTVEQSNPRYDWVITHAWSYFKKAPGPDENAENLPQANAPAQSALRGYTPVTWCAERLPQNIRVVTPEELLWRIRMQYNPAQTKQFMEASARP